LKQLVAFYRREELFAEGKLLARVHQREKVPKGKGKQRRVASVANTIEGTSEAPVVGKALDYGRGF